jgi:hypothetical protein
MTAATLQPGMTRQAAAGPDLILRVHRHQASDGAVCGVSVYTDRYPTGLYYGASSNVDVR